MTKPFAFALHQRVRLRCSNEHGQIIGRAEYPNAEASYLLRYANAAGVAAEAWWGESALVPAESVATTTLHTEAC